MKKTVADITILKLKNGKITYTLTLQQINIQSIQNELAKTINNSGGVQSTTEVKEEIDEDDIPVPKSEIDDEVSQIKQENDELLDEDNIPVPKSEFEINEEIDITTVKVEPENIRLAFPKDISSPYDNKWVPLNEENIDDVQFKDFQILAFVTNDEEDFNIVEAVASEE
ncbi:uncharacterized protein KGF55_002804 [Candida pseudojiufengensis]|uniref:uncharacterized protein n=1 Tax=Candida pseudojiufengensis TaxID=497109 RepID=UPI002224DDFE|nr:uncharacterized protein KGF55_002804 [Candida pseudojiufengensis]KAI5963012.1 hypothetical protein KGF55_002804 [Candida pseudojiufengensis]